MKKTAALILVALLALGMTACAKTTVSKPPYQITIFADSALETAITQVAQAYTDSTINANANEQSEVLLKFAPSDSLKTDISDGAYCDIFICAGQEYMQGLDAVSANVLEIMSTAQEAEAASYPASIMSATDRQEASQAFLDYLHSAKAVEILTNNGFTID